jgi:DNA-binding CsgD family transcriptional regulator
MRDLAARLDDAETFSAIGNALLDAARRETHASSAHVCPLYEGANLALDRAGYSDHHPLDFVMRRALEAWPIAEREVGRITSFFDLPGGVVDFNAHLGPRGLEKTATFNEYFRECKIERQVMAMLGSSQSPLGFICISRSLAERPFTSKELAKLAEIRTLALPAFARVSNQSSSLAVLTTALGAASRSSSAYLALVTQTGQVPWISDDAAADLGVQIWQTGKAAIIPMGHSRMANWLDMVRQANSTRQCSLSSGGINVQHLGSHNGQALYLVIDRARQLRAALPPAWNTLTKREREIAEQLAAGYSVGNVATAFGISPGTVRNHTKRIYRKLGVSTRVELAIRVHGLQGR